MKIGVFGGTFNPPHIGHIKSAKAASAQLGLDMLIIIPARVPPHKDLPDNTPSAEQRLKMARDSFADIPDTLVSDIEIRSASSGYTAETIGLLRQDYPDARMFLLVGTDMFLTLDTWKNSEALLRDVTPAVFSRGAWDAERIERHRSSLLQRYGARCEIIENDAVEISSSQLREMLPRREGIRYINDTTYGYIIKCRFYGAKPDWDWLRDRAYSMLDPRRIPHVAGCEEEALRLAERWGVDPDDARESSILHDITKKLTFAEHMSILESHGMKIGNLQYAEEKLLHSKSGAVLAKTMFGVSDGVFDAIMWHTTGRAGMSDLEKAIYLADYIEPTRDFPGVCELRAAAYEDLDKALIMGLEMSVDDMKARGIIPNMKTFEALDYLKGCHSTEGMD